MTLWQLYLNENKNPREETKRFIEFGKINCITHHIYTLIINIINYKQNDNKNFKTKPKTHMNFSISALSF